MPPILSAQLLEIIPPVISKSFKLFALTPPLLMAALFLKISPPLISNLENCIANIPPPILDSFFVIKPSLIIIVAPLNALIPPP